MADRIRYVNAASAGGDGTTTALSGANAAYASLDAAEQAERTAGSDITAEGNMIFKLKGTTEDTVTCVFGAWTTDATHRVIVECELADRGATPAVWGTDRYRLKVTAAAIAFNSASGIHFLTLRGMAVESARNNVDAQGINVSNATVGTGEIIIEECIVRYTAASASPTAGISVAGNASFKRHVRNCIVHGFGTSAGVGIRCSISAGTGYFYNNTCVANFNGISRVGGTLISKNNLCDNVSDDFVGAMTETNDASSDATALDTNPRINQTFTYAGAAPDYRLASNDAGARTFGVDLSADADFPFSTDILQTTRGATWDIGAHQVTGGVSGGPALMYYHRMMRK